MLSHIHTHAYKLSHTQTVTGNSYTHWSLSRPESAADIKHTHIQTVRHTYTHTLSDTHTHTHYHTHIHTHTGTHTYTHTVPHTYTHRLSLVTVTHTHLYQGLRVLTQYFGVLLDVNNQAVQNYF